MIQIEVNLLELLQTFTVWCRQGKRIFSEGKEPGTLKLRKEMQRKGVGCELTAFESWESKGTPPKK